MRSSFRNVLPVFLAGLCLGLFAQCGSPTQQGLNALTGSACTADDGCASGFCEQRLTGAGKICSAKGCGECEGVDSNGQCTPLTNGSESIVCKGSCSTSYANPTTSGHSVCCANKCVCSATAATCP